MHLFSSFDSFLPTSTFRESNQRITISVVPTRRIVTQNTESLYFPNQNNPTQLTRPAALRLHNDGSTSNTHQVVPERLPNAAIRA